MPDRRRSSLVSNVVTIILVFSLSVCLADNCKPKTHLHKAVHTDMSGKRCWDYVKIQSCRGYCQSHERSHWQFPYKESYHPVCVHAERKPMFVKLRHCDPGVEPSTEDYHYVEAASCKCQVCSSQDTSCEWLPPDSTLLNALMIREEQVLEEEPLEEFN